MPSLHPAARADAVFAYSRRLRTPNKYTPDAADWPGSVPVRIRCPPAGSPSRSEQNWNTETVPSGSQRAVLPEIPAGPENLQTPAPQSSAPPLQNRYYPNRSVHFPEWPVHMHEASLHDNCPRSCPSASLDLPARNSLTDQPLRMRARWPQSPAWRRNQGTRSGETGCTWASPRLHWGYSTVLQTNRW